MVASGSQAQGGKREWAGPALFMISFLVYMTLTQLMYHFDLFFKRTQRLRGKYFQRVWKRVSRHYV